MHSLYSACSAVPTALRCALQDVLARNHAASLCHARPSLRMTLAQARLYLHRLQVRVCKERLQATLGNDRIHPDLKNCTVEVAEDSRVVRVFRQQGGDVTPTSVLQSAHTGFDGTADRPHSYFADITPKMDFQSSEGLCPVFLDLQ